MKALAVIALTLSNVVSGRKYLMDGPNEIKSEGRVMAENACIDMCVFKDDALNQWCFKSNSPHVISGWQFVQTYAQTEAVTPVKYYTLKSGLYLQTAYYLASIFDVVFIYYNSAEFELKKFNLAFYFAQTFTSQFKWCPAILWKIESIDLQITIRHSMQQCFKTLIFDICNFMNPWSGSAAKLFEKCERSQFKASDQVKIAFTTQNFQKKLDDQVYFGTVSPTSKVYCYGIFGVTLAEKNPI